MCQETCDPDMEHLPPPTPLRPASKTVKIAATKRTVYGGPGKTDCTASTKTVFLRISLEEILQTDHIVLTTQHPVTVDNAEEDETIFDKGHYFLITLGYLWAFLYKYIMYFEHVYHMVQLPFLS